MKKIIFFILGLLFVINTNAQKDNTFNLKINDKLFAISKPIEETTTCIVKKNGLKKGTNFITINFVQKTLDNTWKRIITIADEKGNGVQSTEFGNTNGSCKIKFKLPVGIKKQQLIITTNCIPKDAAKAAVIRVRNYTIAKIIIE